MKVFVLRHGQAESIQTTDEARNLTLMGRQNLNANIHRSLSELIQIDEIWASPLLRAQQTAEIVREIMMQHNKIIAIKTVECIAPDSDVSDLFGALSQCNNSSVLLATHQPLASHFMELFCGQAPGYFSMETSSLALIESDTPAMGLGELRWLRHVNG